MSGTSHRFTVERACRELRQSIELLASVSTLLPPEWTHRTTGGSVRGLEADDRSAAQHVAHLILYEEQLAIPVLRELHAGRDGRDAASSGRMSWLKPQINALADAPMDDLLARLQRARIQHIDIVQMFDDGTFNEPRTALWSTGAGNRKESAGWVAMKTAQHTGEHTNAIYRIALFYPEDYV